MKITVLAALIILGLGIGLANAEPAAQPAPQEGTCQYNLTAGAAGWG